MWISKGPMGVKGEAGALVCLSLSVHFLQIQIQHVIEVTVFSLIAFDYQLSFLLVQNLMRLQIGLDCWSFRMWNVCVWLFNTVIIWHLGTARKTWKERNKGREGRTGSTLLEILLILLIVNPNYESIDFSESFSESNAYIIIRQHSSWQVCEMMSVPWLLNL